MRGKDMDIDALRKDLGISKTEFARQIGVSDGHVGDLISGRRKLSLELAAKIEAATNRTGLVEAVLARKMGRAA